MHLEGGIKTLIKIKNDCIGKEKNNSKFNSSELKASSKDDFQESRRAIHFIIKEIRNLLSDQESLLNNLKPSSKISNRKTIAENSYIIKVKIKNAENLLDSLVKINSKDEQQFNLLVSI